MAGKACPALYRLSRHKAGDVLGDACSPALKASGLVQSDAAIDRRFAPIRKSPYRNGG